MFITIAVTEPNQTAATHAVLSNAKLNHYLFYFTLTEKKTLIHALDSEVYE